MLREPGRGERNRAAPSSPGYTAWISFACGHDAKRRGGSVGSIAAMPSMLS